MDTLHGTNWSEWAADWVLRLLTALLLGLLSWAVPKAVALYEKMTGTKVTSEQALRAVAYADEQAHKLARGLIATGPSTPRQKLEVAKAYLRELAPKAVDKLKDVDVERIIESAVNVYRNLVKTKSPTQPPVSPSLAPPA